MRKTVTELLSAPVVCYEIEAWIADANARELEEFILVGTKREVPSHLIHEAKSGLQIILAKDSLKPHWSVVPNFWMTLVAATAGIVAAVAAIIPLWQRDVQEKKPVAANSTKADSRLQTASTNSTLLPTPKK